MWLVKRENNAIECTRHQDAIPFHKYMKINGINQDICYLLTEK